jgi:hypothetical protein
MDWLMILGCTFVLMPRSHTTNSYTTVISLSGLYIIACEFKYFIFFLSTLYISRQIEKLLIKFKSREVYIASAHNSFLSSIKAEIGKIFLQRAS